MLVVPSRFTFIFILVFVLVHLSSGQCSFYEDYSSATGWTQVGFDVEILNGKLHYLNGATDQTMQRRVHKPLGTTLDSHECWVAELDFTPQIVGVKNNLPYTGHVALALTAGTQEPYKDCPDLPCTGKPNGTQDGIMFAYVAFNPPDGDLFFRIHARNSGIEYQSTNYIIAPYLDTTYYLRGSRTSATDVELSVFWDANRTLPLSNSPISLTIPAGVTGLTTVQHGNAVRGEVRRQLTGYLDNLCITWDTTLYGTFLPSDTTFCTGDSIVLNIGQGSQSTYLWSTGSTDSLLTISQGGTYWAKIESGCTSITDTIEVIEKNLLLQLPNDTLLCPGQILTLNIGQGNQASYQWNTGSTDSVLVVTQPGMYIATILDECVATDTILVSYANPLTRQLNDTTACDGQSIQLAYSANNASFFWNTGETDSTIIVTENGVYKVWVTNNCETFVDSARVEFTDCADCHVFLANAFTPGNDNLNEIFEPITNCEGIEFTLKIFDRWGKMVADLTEKDNGWDGRFNGKLLQTGVYSYRFEYIVRKKIPYQREWINGYVTLLR